MIHAIALACLVLWPQAGSLYIAGGHNGQKARPRHVEVKLGGAPLSDKPIGRTCYYPYTIETLEMFETTCNIL